MIQSVKVKNLSLSNDNVRKSNRDADIDALAANIAAQGLLQNLIVTPLKKAGHFTVKAGGRRLRALQRLIEQGTLPADHAVPVLVLTADDNHVEVSLAENFQRVPMNPADESTAFNFLIAKGMSAEDVAKRQGVTTRFVEQRVRLAELAAPVFQALAAGEITLGVAQAYAVTSDIDAQARVFAQMSTSYYGDNPGNIRRAILNGTVKANDAKARFVGRDAYVAAGGRIEGDLFASPGDENWIDVDLLETLGARKLEAAAAELAQAEGLAFVTPIVATHVPYDLERQLHEFHAPVRSCTEDENARISELDAEIDQLSEQLEAEFAEGSSEAEVANNRLDEIERELQAIEQTRRAIDPALKAQIGTFVYIGGDGEARVHTRMFSEKPVVDPNAPPKTTSDNGGLGDGTERIEDSDNGARLSATLVDELATQRRQILVAYLASDAALALDLTIFLMAQSVVFEQAYLPTNSTLKSSGAAFPIFGFRDEGSMASQTIEDQRQRLDTSWAGHKTMTARFDAFRALDDEARGAWAAFAVAHTLEPTLNYGEGSRSNGFHDHLGRLLDIQVENWWRPTAENFFGRVKKDVMLATLEEIGGPVLRGRYKDAKKGELATACASLCNGQGIVEGEIREKALAWLPDAMRFDGIEKPATSTLRSSFTSDDSNPDEQPDGDTGIDEDGEGQFDDGDEAREFDDGDDSNGHGMTEAA